MPTSRATRVTSEAKELSWSTIVLIVFLSSRISPFTSTVIFLVSSPLATAVVTSAMLRTWAVRLPAIEFTLSVRSFQVPATPFTCAWPPSLPSVPTSRATRVTSEANELSWSTIEFTVLPMRRNSPISGRPSMSSAMVCDRSPLATAPITRATSLVGWTRSPIRVLTELTDAAQEPPAPGRCGPLGDPALLAHRQAHPLELLRHLLVQLDDLVERVRDLAGEPGLGHWHPHREVALPDRGEDGEQLVEVEGIGEAVVRAAEASASQSTIAGRRCVRHGGSGTEVRSAGGDQLTSIARVSS